MNRFIFLLAILFSFSVLAEQPEGFTNFLSSKIAEKLEEKNVRMYPEQDGSLKAYLNIDKSLNSISEQEYSDVQIESFDLRSGRFKATIFLTENREKKVQGRFEEFVEIPVLRSRIAKDQVIKESDIYKTFVSSSKFKDNYITDEDSMIGKTAKRPLMAHAPIATSFLQTESLITKNQSVTILYEQGGLEIKMTAKALEDGAAGDVVQVKNMRSGNIVQGVVVDRNLVKVNPN